MGIRELLERKHAITVLLTIYNNPGIIQKEIADKGQSGSTAKQDRIKEQIEAGLIRTDSDGGNWTAIRYFVTDEGARLAKGLMALEAGQEVDPIDYDTPSEEGHKIRN